MKWYDKQKKLFEERNGNDNQEDNTNAMNEDIKKLDPLYKNISKDEQLTESENKNMNYEEDINVNTRTTTSYSDSKTTISKETTIHGNLEMTGNLYLSGTITGDVGCSGELHIDGVVNGNIQAGAIYLDGAEIQGNIACEGSIEIIHSSRVDGNVSAQTMSCDGTIIGDIEINGDLNLLQSSHVEGNITTGLLQTEKGAVIKGQINIISN